MASKRRLRRKACTGKRRRRYATEEEARQGMQRMRRWTGDMSWLVPYRCTFCNGFHFGHPPAKVRQAINARR